MRISGSPVLLALMLATHTLLAQGPQQGRSSDGALTLDEKLVYISHNFMNSQNCEQAIGWLKTAAKAGYTGAVLHDCKFSRWDESVTVRRPEYDNNARRVRQTCRDLGMKAIVCCADMGMDLLSNDPNLAEGMPVAKAPFVVKGGRLVPADDAFRLGNPSFEESRTPHQPTGWNVDFPGQCAFLDAAVRYSGKTSLRFDNIKANSANGNGRANQVVKVDPWRYYHVSVMIRTAGFETPRNVNIIALGKANGLIHQTYEVAATQDWKKYDVVFNTLDNTEITFYVGAWGAGAGSIWFDDICYEPGGFVNLIRREGCPFQIDSEDGAVRYAEHKDFTDARDPKMGNTDWPGLYKYWYEQPVVRVPAGSRLQEGQKVLVSYYHCMNTLGWGVFACMAEPKVLEIIRKQVAAIHQVLEPDGYMMTHDEIRHMGWDESCRKKGRSMAELLAGNVRDCARIIRKEDPGKLVYVWSDMFDPHQNAGKTGYYYLVRGKDPWYGSWEGLDKDIVIVNWHNFNPGRAEALKWFAERGHRQILAGYYDAPSTNILPWLEEAKRAPGVSGVMYTTWAQDFGELSTFIRVVNDWQAGAASQRK